MARIKALTLSVFFDSDNLMLCVALLLAQLEKKANAGVQGGDRNICNMLLSRDLSLALVLCTNSKKA